MYIGGATPLRKNPPTPFGLQFKAALFKKIDHVVNPKGVEGGQKGFAVTTEGFDKLARVGFAVGDVTASLAGYQQFCPAAAVLFQQQYPGAVFGGKAGGENSGRATANNNQVIFFHSAGYLVCIIRGLKRSVRP